MPILPTCSRPPRPLPCRPPFRRRIERLRRLASRAIPIVLIGPAGLVTRSAELPGAPCSDSLHKPGKLSGIRDRRRARRARQASPSGTGSARWVAAAPPAWHAAALMRDDHVHFNRDGGDRIGRMLFADLCEPAEGGR